MNFLTRASRQIVRATDNTSTSLVRGSNGVFAPARRANVGSGGVGYNAAGSGRRAQGWSSTVQGVNSILFADIWKLLQRSREQTRQNPWAVNGIEKYVSNAIGNGIKPHPQHPDAGVRKLLTESWSQFNDCADLDGLLPFDGLQSLAVRSMLEGGECFIRMMTINDDPDLIVPLQLRLMETEQLPHYMIQFPEVPEGNIIRMGVEMEADTHRRVAYHFFAEHPYETVMYPMPNAKYIRIPKQDIAHHFKPLRPGQIRGIPWMAPVLAALYEIDQTFDAELARQKTQALFAAFVTMNSGTDEFLDESNLTSSDPTGSSGLDAALPSMEPGALIKLLPNEDVKFATPTGTSAFGDFMRTALYAVAAAMGVTYEQLTGDLSGVNYSSIRAGLLEFRRQIESYQITIFAFQVLRPVWRRFIKMGVVSGLFPFRDYKNPARRMEYESVYWQPPGWDWVDPAKDIVAATNSIRAGLDSRERICMERGLNPEDVDRDNKIAKDRAVSLGLVYESDTSQVLQRGETLIGSEAQVTKEEKEEPEGSQPANKGNDNSDDGSDDDGEDKPSNSNSKPKGGIRNTSNPGQKAARGVRGTTLQ